MSDRRLEHLFERFRVQGDVHALGQVFDATAPALRRVARHLTRDVAEAEDLVQATFLAAIEKRATFDVARKVSPWLTGILLKLASVVRRARRRAIEPDRLAERSVEDPLDAAAARELSEALTVALTRLSASDRDVLIPLLLDGRRAVEIARELGRRPDTVNMRIHRGLARLRQLLPASFAVAALARFGGARGLSVVRSEVLRSARLEVALCGVGSAGVAAVGIAMSMKKLAVVLALVVSLGVGGYVVATIAGDFDTARAAQFDIVKLEPDILGASQAPADENARAPAVSGAREAQTGPLSETQLIIDIVRERDGAAADVLVALVDGEGKVKAARTDEAGRCEFAPGTGSGHVYVRDEAAFPRHFVVELAPGRRTIELPRGSELSGRLGMSGGEPMPRIELLLTTDCAPEGLTAASKDVFRALDMLQYDEPLLVARTALSRDGAFRFRVPDASWSGALQLPPELVFVAGAQPTRSSERIVEQAAANFEADIAYRPRVIGRLVDAATHDPVSNAVLECSLIWSDGNGMGTSGRTSSDGRFIIALDDYRTDAIELRIDGVRAPGGRLARVPNSPKWKGACEPFDAGDIECVFQAARPIVFRAVDSNGAPLRGARARIREVEVVTADDRGVGTFGAVPFESREMRVVAVGHRIAAVQLSEDTVSPLDVVLARTNRLTIALPSEAAGRKDLYVELASRQLLFGGTSRMYDWALRGEMVGQCFSADGDGGTREGSVRLGFSAEGRIEVEDIATGIPFRVRLAGWESRGAPVAALAEVAIDALGAEEHRRVDLVLDPSVAGSMRVLRGRALDESGRPIHQAGIEAQIGQWFVGTRTEMDGTFRYDLSNWDTVDVDVTKRGYIPFRSKAWDLTSDRSLEATLRRGRDVRVELVDALGRAIPGAHVDADIEGFGRPWKILDSAPGVHVLCDVPPGRADLTIRIAERDYSRTYDGVGDVVRLVLPGHGRLELQWMIDEVAVSGRSFQIALRPLDPDVEAQFEWTPHVQRAEGHVFEALLPGEYTVSIEAGSAHSSNGDTVFTPLRGPLKVTIVAGATERVTL